MYLPKRCERRYGKEHPSSSLLSPRQFFFCVYADFIVDPEWIQMVPILMRSIIQVEGMQMLPVCPVLQEQQEQFDVGALMKSLQINS